MADSTYKQCSLQNCSRQFFAGGWCKAHYTRWLKTGDPRPDEPIRFRKGTPKPQETRDKISVAKIGQKYQIHIPITARPHNQGDKHWSFGKKRPEISGENHYNWRGGTGTERHRAMQSLEYRNWRDAVFAQDNYTCQICDEYGGYLNADHIKGWKNHPELRYEVANGRTLCRACHYYITFKRKMPQLSRWGITKGIKVWALTLSTSPPTS